MALVKTKKSDNCCELVEKNNLLCHEILWRIDISHKITIGEFHASHSDSGTGELSTVQQSMCQRKNDIQSLRSEQDFWF